MSAKRTTISLPGKLHEEAIKRTQALHFATLSDYIQHLVRQDVLSDCEIGKSLKPQAKVRKGKLKGKPIKNTRPTRGETVNSLEL